MKKAIEDRKDIQLTLLEYTNSSAENSCSPAELLYERRVKGLLPIMKTETNVKCKGEKNRLIKNQNNKNSIQIKMQDHFQILMRVQELWCRIIWISYGIQEPIKKDTYRPRSYQIRLDNTQNVTTSNRRFVKSFIDKETNMNGTNDEMYEEIFLNFYSQYKTTDDDQLLNQPSTSTKDNARQIVMTETNSKPLIKEPLKRNVSKPVKFKDYHLY
ncbi:hypothetical protein QE152_g29372 [Popillia japonica]|uniref:Protein TIC 214 n=1 Tax=Popillia japonica TaxID=7064 RepID=A0AAW1JHG8_POPJA